MEEHGVVVEIKNNNTAVVRATRSSACDSCGSKKSCATGGGEDMLVETDNAIGADKGDHVVFAVGAGAVMKAGVIVHFVPTVAFIAGVVLGQLVVAPILPGINKDLISGVLGFIFLVDAYVCLKIYNKKLDKKGAAMRPKLLRKV